MAKWSNFRLPPLLIGSLLLALGGCSGAPEGVTPVTDFDVSRYLGKWYEIARLDHSFERGLDRVTAEYSLRPDGGIRVINRGVSIADNRVKEAEGKAFFVGDQTEGHLKVSFFGPFYGAYVVFGLDRDDYQFAYVAGPSRDYLWLLARTPLVSPEVLEAFINASRSLGFPTEALIYVNQE